MSNFILFYKARKLLRQQNEKFNLQTRQIQPIHNWEENTSQEYSAHDKNDSKNVGQIKSYTENLPKSTIAATDPNYDWSEPIDNIENDWSTSSHDATSDWSDSNQNVDSDWYHPSQILDYDWSEYNKDIDTRKNLETVTKRNEGSSEKEWISSKLNHHFFDSQSDLKLTSWPLVNPSDGSYSITIAL